ncbi:MAG: hypothetical protein V2A54_08165 [Bacteroidota bacterium]
MKPLLLLIFVACAASLAYSQNDQKTADPDSVLVKSRVEFYMFDGPYGDKERLKEPAIKFILTVKNKGTKPIPDLQVSNRSEYVNFLLMAKTTIRFLCITDWKRWARTCLQRMHRTNTSGGFLRRMRMEKYSRCNGNT